MEDSTVYLCFGVIASIFIVLMSINFIFFSVKTGQGILVKKEIDVGEYHGRVIYFLMIYINEIDDTWGLDVSKEFYDTIEVGQVFSVDYFIGIVFRNFNNIKCVQKV